jgi:hypothetical protein
MIHRNQDVLAPKPADLLLLNERQPTGCESPIL